MRVFIVTVLLLSLCCAFSEGKKYSVDFRGLLGDFCGNDTDIEGCEECEECEACPSPSPFIPLCGDGSERICASECPLECPSPSPCPSECPSPSPIPSPSPCPLECPSPSPIPSPSPCPLECPSPSPIVCPSPSPVPSPSPCPNECPSPSPCPNECPSPSPIPSPSPCPLECPSPSPIPSPSPCPLECPSPSPIPSPSPCPSECPSPSPCPSPGPQCEPGESLFCVERCPIGQTLGCIDPITDICGDGKDPICPEDCPVTDICEPPPVDECPEEADAEFVRVGIASATTGYAQYSQSPIFYGTLLAVDEINRAGGVNVAGKSKQILPIHLDTGSSPNNARVVVGKLITEHCVQVVFGTGTAPERKESLGVVEQANNLLIQPGAWEGAEFSANVFHTGGDIAQRVKTAIDYAFDVLGRNRFILIGSDEVGSRVVNLFAQTYILQRGGFVDLIFYVPVGAAEDEDDEIYSAPQEIGDQMRDLDTCPQGQNCIAILNTQYGRGSNRVLHKALSARGISPSKKPTISLRMLEWDIRNITEAVGQYVVANYLQSLDFGPNNNFKANAATYLGGSNAEWTTTTDDTFVNAYNAVHLWKKAVEAAGTAVPGVVKNVLPGTSFDGPAGTVQFSDVNTMATKTAYVGRLTRDGPNGQLWATQVSSEADIPTNLYPPPLLQSDYEAFIQSRYNDGNQAWQGPSFNP
eukprot:TRINITY_DN276_c0_g1_i1.p1 TRINITY_DN276_c0_g1~~TRINITY_DN276_c0_g1_i1.p1  ORF type:complete len:696 (-),score=82.16 TRINITY_DN276_c0_g1_i1:73-2160(-)